ncbi:unnamed protein product [Oppiella nova]|uniref:Uncharacterized protein n=1 Tax=Oppiella nova TaxID=334625 RepID=A0A7R9LUX7_9ACAR|nr:unnamed protein product [Oppiella nova]CAG2167208.1 unnamed protein product [Oppiella nova]
MNSVPILTLLLVTIIGCTVDVNAKQKTKKLYEIPEPLSSDIISTPSDIESVTTGDEQSLDANPSATGGGRPMEPNTNDKTTNGETTSVYGLGTDSSDIISTTGDTRNVQSMDSSNSNDISNQPMATDSQDETTGDEQSKPSNSLDVTTNPSDTGSGQPIGTDAQHNPTAKPVKGQGKGNACNAGANASQEPGANAAEILNGIKYVRPGNGFEPNFMVSKKIDVNGLKEHPLYSYLKRSCPSTQSDFSNREKLFYDKLHERDVRWNWEKFLIHPITGQPIKRYDASYEPHLIAPDIMRTALNRTIGSLNNTIQTRL